jgi:hypothetical protein
VRIKANIHNGVRCKFSPSRDQIDNTPYECTIRCQLVMKLCGNSVRILAYKKWDLLFTQVDGVERNEAKGASIISGNWDRYSEAGKDLDLWVDNCGDWKGSILGIDTIT